METAVALVVMKYLTDVHNGSVGVKASGSEGIGEKEKKHCQDCRDCREGKENTANTAEK